MKAQELQENMNKSIEATQRNFNTIRTGRANASLVDRINVEQRYAKIKQGSENLLPHLIRESCHYWSNVYFWLYFGRTLFEYLVSRHILIFKLLNARAVRVWKAFFGN